MKKVLIVLLVILLLIGGGAGYYLWYQNAHIFVEDAVYAKNSIYLDLRGTDISVEHYNSLREQLPKCEILWDVPFQGGAHSNDSTSLTITSLTEADRAMLKYFPSLTSVDATGCSDYAQLEALREQLPKCEILYQVDLGGISVDPDVTELTLEPGDFDYTVLMQNLSHLPQVQSILLNKTDLTLEEIDNIHMDYSQIAVDYTVELLGQEYPSGTTELNLSSMTSEEVEAVSAVLPMLVNVTSLELMDANGSTGLSLEDVKNLKAAAPNATIHYTFDFFGITVSTTDEEVKLSNKKIGDENEAQVRLALDVLENCSRMVLDNCRISDEVLAQIREDYRDKTKLVWRVWFGDGGSCLTDVEVLRAVYGLTDDNSHDLVYCEDVLFMDLGHSEFLDAVPFVEGMTKLQAVIVSGSPIKDLTPFASCTDLRVLEIANCTYVTDLSPLANCLTLEMLNICYTGVSDLSPLDELVLTHLHAKKAKITDESRQNFVMLHPDCWSCFDGDQPYGVGWRYANNEGTEKLPWYQKMCDAFGYPNPNNNTGWYLK